MMPMDEEQSAREAVERMIADWDAAFAEGNAQGVVGHCLPNDAQHEDCHRRWALVMDWMEDAAAHSTIQQFRLHEGRVTMVVETRRSFCYCRPLPEYAPLGRALLGFVARFVFAEREVSRLVWVNTQEGWLCQSEKRLSYRVRMRRRAASV